DPARQPLFGQRVQGQAAAGATRPPFREDRVRRRSRRDNGTWFVAV
ncbi:MAG: hypothetical protein AVDCRST_MAG03-1894, partial [uncultured Rubrobacteraceae bacterium]